MTDDLFARRDLVRRGVSDSEIRGARRSGAICPVRRGWYAAQGAMAQLTDEERHLVLARATLGGSGGGSALSHESAALALGLSLWQGPPDLVHVSVDRASGSRRSAERYRHCARLDEADVRVVDSMRVTSPARTVADLACSLTFEEAVCVGDSAIRVYGIDVTDVLDALSRCGRRHGAARARRAIAFLDGRSESVGESRSRVYLQRYDVPMPELQVELVAGGRLFRPDFLWRVDRLIGEFDGLAKYSGGGETVVQEKLREDALRAAGWRVQRWTWAELSDNRLAHRLLGALKG
ncbi:MAG: hypothetical protein WA931_18070 [Rhodococcus sp. (in: high G+C Gram-positive bacteria)]